MFEYYVCNGADDEIFAQQCAAIEKNAAFLEKKELLVDVDGTLIQAYGYPGKDIKVYSDHLADEVYIKSEIDLKSFFNTAVQ